jgi:hypothetical protein
VGGVEREGELRLGRGSGRAVELDRRAAAVHMPRGGAVAFPAVPAAGAEGGKVGALRTRGGREREQRQTTHESSRDQTAYRDRRTPAARPPRRSG